jgi:hypothetical protein
LRSIVVVMVRPPRSSSRVRSARVAPNVGSLRIVLSTKSQKNGTFESLQPLVRFFCTLSPILVAVAVATSAELASPTSSIRASTMLRRVRAASGCLIGSKALGCCTMPASSAASGSVSALALLLK